MTAHPAVLAFGVLALLFVVLVAVEHVRTGANSLDSRPNLTTPGAGPVTISHVRRLEEPHPGGGRGADDGAVRAGAVTAGAVPHVASEGEAEVTTSGGTAPVQPPPRRTADASDTRRSAR